MKLISFYTENLRLQGGSLFLNKRLLGGYPSQPFAELKDCLQAFRYTVVTHDQVVASSPPHLIILLDLPSDPGVVKTLRASAPNAILVLYILESPPHHPGQFNPANYHLFDHVITYNASQADGKKIHYCPIPFDLPRLEDHECLDSWSSRKQLCLINSRKSAGFLVDSGKGSLHRFGIRGLGEPWKTSKRKILTQWSGYQYGLRNSLVEQLDRIYAGTQHFSVYGPGWDGCPANYWERFVAPPRPVDAWKGCYDGDKTNLLREYRYCLVVENWIGNEGYISEKFFEVVASRCVPIYWGSPIALAKLPNSCYIDGRKLKSAANIARFVQSESSIDWERRIHSVSQFCKSDFFLQRSPKGYAARMLEILMRLTEDRV